MAHRWTGRQWYDKTHGPSNQKSNVSPWSEEPWSIWHRLCLQKKVVHVMVPANLMLHIEGIIIILSAFVHRFSIISIIFSSCSHHFPIKTMLPNIFLRFSHHFLIISHEFCRLKMARNQVRGCWLRVLSGGPCTGHQTRNLHDAGDLRTFQRLVLLEVTR